MFRGHYEHAIDGKGRTSLPARFRHAMPGDAKLVLAPGLADRCLDVYPMAAWEDFEQRVALLPKWDRDTVLLRRRYVSAAVECELDGHGRVLVPAVLRDHAGLKKDVLWAGVGTTIELWSRDRWQTAQHIEGDELERWTLAIAQKLNL